MIQRRACAAALGDKRAIRMNFIEEFFTRNSGVLVDRLQAAGYTFEQASRFLPEASSEVLRSFRYKDVDAIIKALSMEKPNELLGSVDVDRLAEKLGMNASQAKQGFELIAPIMAKAFLVNRRGIVGAAASIAVGTRKESAETSGTSAW